MLDFLWRENAETRAWLRLSAFYGGLVVLLLIFRARFDWERDLIDTPALLLAVGMVCAGLAYLWTLRLAEAFERMSVPDQRALLALVVGVGLTLRLALLWSTPALEDDYHRYLWDGAITAHALNPYAIAPQDAPGPTSPQLVRDLAANAGYVFDRINHAKVRTIYPPVAQAFFAIAYLAEPWSLLAWRLVCLAAEGVSLGLLLLLLRETGRSPLWVALYWLNPLVIKELVNSAHMEAIVVPFVLGTVLLAIRGRLLAACMMLVLAAGTKVWPLLFVPLVLRPLVGDWRRLLAAVAIISVGTSVVAVPMILAGLEPNAGVVAYASSWQRNGALVPGLTSAIAAAGLADQTAGTVARGLVAITAGLIALMLATKPIAGAADFARRSALLATAVLLLSPAQYPWYLAWVMPFMALFPIRGMLLATALMPIYYASFYFRALGIESVFNTYVVWLIWLPIWSTLWVDWRHAIRARS